VAASGDTPRFVLLVVDKTGQVFLDDKPVAPAELARRLVLVAGKNPDTEVQLRADEAVPYGRVVEVLGAAQKAGLSRIGFVAEPKPAAP
jgi:biopolymer transport protein TolR